MQGMVLRPVQRCAAKGVAKGKANLDLARKAAQRTVSKKTLASAEGRCRGDTLARNGHCDKATRGGDLGARKEASRAGSGKGRNARMGLTLHPAPANRGQHWRLFSLDGAASESRGAWGGNGSNGGGRTGGGSGGRGGGNGSSGPSGKGPQGGESMGLFALYLALMDKHPLPSKIVTTGVLNFIGDLICQLAIEKQEFDANRSAIFTALGLVLVGPALHFWYLRLSKIVAGFGLKSNAAAVASLTLDQFTFAPIFIATFLSSLSLFEVREPIGSDGPCCRNVLFRQFVGILTRIFVVAKLRVTRPTSSPGCKVIGSIR